MYVASREVLCLNLGILVFRQFGPEPRTRSFQLFGRDDYPHLPSMAAHLFEFTRRPHDLGLKLPELRRSS